MNEKNDIIAYPNDILREKCEPIEEVSQEVIELRKKLENCLLEAGNGAGLSAPQVGENRQMFVIADDNHVHTYINPQIIDHEEEKTYPQLITEQGDRQDFYEGCLSFPDLYGTVKRWLEIKVRYQIINENKELEEKEEELTGFMAIVFQHEFDHLNGVLFVDHIEQEDGKVFKEVEGKLKEVDIEEVIKS